MFVPQLLEKTQQNLEFPKYHIVNTPPPPQFRTLLENTETPFLVGQNKLTPSTAVSFTPVAEPPFCDIPGLHHCA